uniref:Uncharacterized protein n=1 Tax=Arundo donax TaxID=35708 RepID=A0A0A8YGT2_ARUDO
MHNIWTEQWPRHDSSLQFPFHCLCTHPRKPSCARLACSNMSRCATS